MTFLVTPQVTRKERDRGPLRPVGERLDDQAVSNTGHAILSDPGGDALLDVIGEHALIPGHGWDAQELQGRAHQVVGERLALRR